MIKKDRHPFIRDTASTVIKGKNKWGRREVLAYLGNQLINTDSNGQQRKNCAKNALFPILNIRLKS